MLHKKGEINRKSPYSLTRTSTGTMGKIKYVALNNGFQFTTPFKEINIALLVQGYSKRTRWENVETSNNQEKQTQTSIYLGNSFLVRCCQLQIFPQNRSLKNIYVVKFCSKFYV